jgi:hypothetical protein
MKITSNVTSQQTSALLTQTYDWIIRGLPWCQISLALPSPEG